MLINQITNEYAGLQSDKVDNSNYFFQEKIEIQPSNQFNKFPSNISNVYTIITSEPVLKFTNFSNTDILHFNYGEVSFKVEETNENYIKCVALNSGMIQRYNSISVEGKEHFTNDLINFDENKLKKELNSAKDLDVDFVVMSVIENPTSEIKYLKIKLLLT